MEFGGECDLPTDEVIDFSRAVARFTDSNFPASAPIEVTFVMQDTMFDHTFASIPDYVELWKTLCNELDLTASACVPFKIQMDDVLLTNRNTVDMLTEATQSAAANASIILTVTKASDPTRVPRKGRSCGWAFPHVLYLSVLLLLTFFVNRKLTSQIETINIDMATIESLTRILSAVKEQRAQQMSDCARKLTNATERVKSNGHAIRSLSRVAQWSEEKLQRTAEMERLAKTLAATREQHAGKVHECDSKITNMTQVLEENDHRIRNLTTIAQHRKNVSHNDVATIDRLSRELEKMRADKKKYSECTRNVGGEMLWVCSLECDCLHLL